MRHIIPTAVLTLTLSLLTACGQAPNSVEQECLSGACTEAEINQPVEGSVEDPSLPEEVELEAFVDYRMPAYSSSFGVPRAMYQRASAYYDKNRSRLPNRRYVTIIDFNRKSNERRFFLFDLKTGTIKRHLVSHGEGSDPNNTGYATRFSNTDGSHMSSLGFYITDATYTGANGYSLRLRGQDSTNSNAYARAIVMHPANYVKEEVPSSGRSWGCPALDKDVSKGVIDKVKGGSLLYISR